MAECLITTGWETPDCTEKFNVPGIERDEIWVANRSEITAISSSVAGEVDGFTFLAATGFKKIAFHKNTGNVSEELVKAENSGAYYNQTFTGRVIDDSTDVREAIQDMVDVDLVIAVRKKNDKFVLIGENGGVTLTENTKQSGATDGDDTGDVLTFTGRNLGKSRYVFDTDVATTQALLDGLVA